MRRRGPAGRTRTAHAGGKRRQAPSRKTEKRNSPQGYVVAASTSYERADPLVPL